MTGHPRVHVFGRRSIASKALLESLDVESDGAPPDEAGINVTDATGDDWIVLDQSTMSLDHGRPETGAGLRPNLPLDLPLTARVLLLSSALVSAMGGHSSAATLEAAVLNHPRGTVIRLDRVLGREDPLLVRWHLALKEGVPVAPLPCRCAPVDSHVAAAASLALLRRSDVRGLFSLRAPDEIGYIDIARDLVARLGLPEDRVVPSQLVPKDFGLDAWPVGGATKSSGVFAKRGVRPRASRMVVDHVLTGLLR